MAITKVEIIEGCISCGVCEAAAPEVFEMTDIAHVKAGVDLNKYEAQIQQAAADCPTAVIKIS